MCPSRGGSREGSGRPVGTGKYGERTVQVRVPASLQPQIVSYLEARRMRKHGLGGGSSLPFPALDSIVHAVPAHLNPKSLTLPSVGQRVQAGAPSPADDYMDEGCDLNQLLVRNPPSTYFVTAMGTSMNKLGIFDGTRLVVDRSIDPKHGHIVVAIILGEGLTVKRLHLTASEAALEPESLDPIHERRVMTEYDEWTVWGVVTNWINQAGI